MAKLLKQFYLEKEQVKYLERESKRTGKSQAEIVRELIDKKRKQVMPVRYPINSIESLEPMQPRYKNESLDTKQPSNINESEMIIHLSKSNESRFKIQAGNLNESLQGKHPCN